MAAWRHLLAGLVAAVGAAGAWAQPKVELGRSPALDCLRPAGADLSAPDYPGEEWKLRIAGRVKVQLEFGGPDQAPQISVLEREGSEEFVRTVRDHVAPWRVPCALPGQKVRLVKEYVFRPDERKVAAPPAWDAADAQRRAAAACMTHVDGETSPSYPSAALRDRQTGRVMALLTFRSPSEPPAVQVFARPSAARLERHVAEWSRGLRLPCLSGEYVYIAYSHHFAYMSDPGAGLRPLLLQEVLPRVKGIRQRALALDTSTMARPFDVRFTYLKPRYSNLVGALGDWKPGREPLLDFLRDVELELPESALDTIYADQTTITVPCLKIDLKPQGDKQ